MAYSWITPKTNWKSGDFCTYRDINRIINNILYLYEAISVTPLYPDYLPVNQANYWMNENSFNRAQREVYQLYGLIGCNSEYPFIYNKTNNSSPWSSTDLNTIESILLDCKDIVDSSNYTLNYVYAGADMYCNNDALL